MNRRVFMAAAAASTVAASLALAGNVETVNYEDVVWVFCYFDDDKLYFSTTYTADKHFVYGYHDGKHLTECSMEESNIIVNGYPDKNTYFKAQIFSPTTFEVF